MQLKTGYDTDRGTSWIGWVDFSKTWRTAYFQGRTLRRATGLGLFDANFHDVETGQPFWISGPKRDRSDTRYGPQEPTMEDDAADAYRAFLQGALRREDG